MAQDLDFDEEDQSKKDKKSDSSLNNKNDDEELNKSSSEFHAEGSGNLINQAGRDINIDKLEVKEAKFELDEKKVLDRLSDIFEKEVISKILDRLNKPDNKEEDEGGVKHLPDEGFAWFRQQNIKTQSFIIALLFFPSTSLHFLEELSNDIVKLINKGKTSLDSEQKNSIFDQNLSIQSLIDEDVIAIINTKIETDAGILNSDVVVFANASFFEKMLEIILSNHDLVRLHPLLETWLIKQINKNDQSLYSIGALDVESIRIQSSYGLGLLARKNFTSTLISTIDVWANAESPYTRLLVGWIFLGYYQNEKSKEYWNTMSSLLNTWVSSDNYFKRWTAIASTTRLGLIYSEEDDTSLNISLSIYKEISKLSQSNHFKGVLSKCIRFLFSLSPYHARVICNELANWIKKDDESSKVSLIASELFIEIVNVKIKTDNINSDDEISLWELCESESYVLSDSVALLIRESFLHPRGRFVDRAINELHQSIEELLSNDLVQHKALSNILKHINADKSLNKYMSLVIDKKHNFLLNS